MSGRAVLRLDLVSSRDSIRIANYRVYGGNPLIEIRDSRVSDTGVSSVGA